MMFEISEIAQRSFQEIGKMSDVTSSKDIRSAIKFYVSANMMLVDTFKFI